MSLREVDLEGGEGLTLLHNQVLSGNEERTVVVSSNWVAGRIRLVILEPQSAQDCVTRQRKDNIAITNGIAIYIQLLNMARVCSRHHIFQSPDAS